MKKKISALITSGLLLAGCSSSTAATANIATTNTSVLDTSSMFKERELRQSVENQNAAELTLISGEDITITDEGIYVLNGDVTDVTVYVEADDTEKVQIVLNDVSIVNENDPVIYVLNGDKVFVTSIGDNTLSTIGTFAADDSNNVDAVIYSASDLVLNGTGTLTITSSDIGIRSKDDLKITGGTYNITSATVGIRANDSIRVYDGTINIAAGTDGMHAENKNDDTLGYIYIQNGTITINCIDDAIHGQSVVQIDGGTFDITAREGIESTYIQIHGGTFTIVADDDGMNAGSKSSAYNVTIEINGGNITVITSSSATDAIDSNGDLIITGGTIDITAASGFDYTGTCTFTGGTVTVNGEEVTEIASSDL